MAVNAVEKVGNEKPQFVGDQGARVARSMMNEQSLLSAGGWANSYYPKIRSDLYLMIDDDGTCLTA